MCGISGIINLKNVTGNDLLRLNADIKHRGPDDEGYLTWAPGADPLLWAGADTSEPSIRSHQLQRLEPGCSFRVGLGHRRLSILDLSPAGHQPMLLPGAGLAIVFNGEMYNYIEVREELKKEGIRFTTNSDTEVILHAWAKWGKNALTKFNGMFAFLLLDFRQQKLYAVRDRFGVKPLYYTQQSDYIAFASELKQLRNLQSYRFVLNERVAYDYLKYSYIDHLPDTFEQGLYQLLPGHLMEVDIRTGSIGIEQWYVLQPRKWEGDTTEAFEEFRRLLYSAVKLRMRSDVPVGSALSGGLDSSTIVCLMRQILDDEGHAGKQLETVTSSSEDKKFDETAFAEIINAHNNCKSHKVYPDFDKLKQDFERLVWHMDYPFGSTSQFSQWCVFQKAAEAGLTVMIDGQGADEQLAGYGGNDLSLYAGLIAKGNAKGLWEEIKAYRQKFGMLPKGFLLGGFAELFPGQIKRMLPKKFQVLQPSSSFWMRYQKESSRQIANSSLQSHLIGQVQVAPLPALLRYEDRNSMAFSVESRTPFMDYRLMEFTLGLPERLVYRNNQRKYILREAFRNIVPSEILDRKDKMGFVSAEERWLKQDGKEWFTDKVNNGANSLVDFADEAKVAVLLKDMRDGKQEFNFDPWRILCMGYWLRKR